MIDNLKIQLQENIPLTDEDLKHIETQRIGHKKMALILGVCTVAVMAFAAWCMRGDFASFRYYDYILFTLGGFALFGFGYLMASLISWYDNKNWKKDKLNGKSKLVSVIINRDKTEYGEYLTFAGTEKDKIRIRVTQKDYRHYKVGTKVQVTYLKFSKEALNIIEC